MTRGGITSIGVVVAVGVSVLTGAAHQTRPPVFTARRDLVRLDVSVTDRGKPITGLQAGDFTVVDNGVPQKVEYLSFDELALNIVLAFDASGSVAGPRVTDLRAAGIGCNIYFPPIHLQPYMVEKFGFKSGDFPVCEYVANRTIALPFFTKMTRYQIDRVCDTLEKILERTLVGRKPRF